MNFFLRLRHWQLFLLMVGVPFVFQVIFMAVMIGSRDARGLLVMFPIIMLCYIGTYFGWLYSVGKVMHQKSPTGLRRNLGRFQVFMLIPVVYMLCISVFIAVMGQGFELNEHSPVAIVSIVLPLHLFSMCCIFYCLYFCARSLKTAEWQRPVTFSDYAGEFFLLWFFPIGIWILQPRINRLAAEAGDNTQLTTGEIFP